MSRSYSSRGNSTSLIALTVCACRTAGTRNIR
ncbi:uncharacterized protein GLRG_11568 [Colletotrichum graminicola M1.001]|uniref:Uncharacterized protein n=1 Tax=Colletotrichum graminicola (strain M1.001 / M2 / FGSC 10212) TaxID=645133 RepID=E3QZW2_COLGM|nr:uncharacterized protein GLRG_11568 [Colletotrichum graminicola M1.001]EFQ36400.1 hypothetical protein GLRG_11568 [Colletotrichum graminicola M1.001]